MSIDWNALATVFVVGLVVTVGLVGLFTVGIVGLSKRPSAEGRGAGVPLARAGACLCFAVAAAAVLYGIHLVAG